MTDKPTTFETTITWHDPKENYPPLSKSILIKYKSLENPVRTRIFHKEIMDESIKDMEFWAHPPEIDKDYEIKVELQKEAREALLKIAPELREFD